MSCMYMACALTYMSHEVRAGMPIPAAWFAPLTIAVASLRGSSKGVPGARMIV